MKTPPPDLRAKILAAAKAEPAPTRDQFQRITMLSLGLALVASLAIFFSVGGYRRGDRPEAYVLGLCVPWAVCAAVLFALAAWRGRANLGRTVPALLALFALAPLSLLIISVVGHAIWPETDLLGDDRNDLRCAAYAGAMGVLPLLGFLYSRRHVMYAQPFWSCAAVGAASFAFGSLLITLRCMCATLPHLIVGHVVPVAVFGALSGWLGAWYLKRANRRA
jgi:hypothetical protein